MFSVDNFYNYLNQFFIDGKKDVDMKSFNVHGSRSLKDIVLPSFNNVPNRPLRYTGQCVMFDQEPIELNYFTDWRNFDPADYNKGFEYHETGDLYKNLTPLEFICRHFSGVYNPIICHSERNSPEIDFFKANNFHPVHYFYHGLIARDWFRHWKHYSMKPQSNATRLGLYARDASGSREYRLDMLHQLTPYRNQIHYYLQEPIRKIEPALADDWPINHLKFSSDASATINPDDAKRFRIQIVPETLFRTQKTHLTEKVFKPMVMKQPFIVVGPPNSLSYLQKYGFETFSELWDESYDSIPDADDRLKAIIKVVNRLHSLSDVTFDILMKRANRIVEHNHKHFYSQKFEDEMLTELHHNMDFALRTRESSFNLMPGGTWFKYLDQLNKAGHDITEFNRVRNRNIAEYLLKHHPVVGNNVIRSFSTLF